MNELSRRFTIAALLSGLGMAGCGSASSTSGPTVSVRPDRTVSVTATDQLRFSPPTITVRPGESVAFRVTNAGSLRHEFLIGNADAQAQHDREMQSAGSGMHMGAEPGSADVAPGATSTVVYTFPQSGTLLYGCHVPGHYAGGMKGTIVIG